METKAIRESLAYCGLICKLCSSTEECDGCKQTASKSCYQKTCCLEQHLNGCWECAKFPCHEGMYRNEDNPKVKAFAQCVREDGAEKFIEYVMENMQAGLSVQGGKDYDFRPVDDVLQLLRTGRI